MEDKNILTVPEAQITEGSFLFAEVGGALVKTPVDSLPTGGGGEGGDRSVPNGTVMVSLSDSGDEENDVPEEVAEPSLNADTFGGHKPEYYTKQADFIAANTYSYEETRIGTWIDGKPLYRKMIDFGSLPNNARKVISSGIENVDYGYINLGPSSWHSSSGTNSYSFVQSNITDVEYIHSANNLSIITSADLSSYMGIVCFEYTKTTDQANPSS